MEPESKSITSTAANVGCVLALALALAVGVVFSLRSGACTVTFDHNTTELTRVQTALRKRFRAPQLTVRERDEDGATLVIGVLNAPFLADLEFGTPEAKQAALHVAGHARDELPPEAHYDHYEVLLEQRVDVPLVPFPSQTWRFAPAELPPR